MTRPTHPDSKPPYILLVEGQNDKHVVGHICARLQLALSFSIVDKDGIDNLQSSIFTEINDSDRQTVGILVDANDNLTARWDAVTEQIRRAGIDPPASPDSAGTIIESKPRVGIWLMPDNTSPGELEDFVVQMIPAGDRVWPLSNRYIEEIPTEDRKFIESKTQRAKLHAWLAAREDPRQMGLAIKTKDLEIEGPLCQKFVVWLTKLFG